MDISRRFLYVPTQLQGCNIFLSPPFLKGSSLHLDVYLFLGNVTERGAQFPQHDDNTLLTYQTERMVELR